jgi:hypothetical protein
MMMPELVMPVVVLVLIFEPTFAVDCGHTARTSRGDRLSIGVVLHITTGKYAVNVGVRGTLAGEEIPRLFHVEYARKHVGVWSVTNCNKKSSNAKWASVTGDGVGKSDAL